ncbi:uncharacterized protein TNCV_113961 [Trichonephila clavipes]|nr:uncharacterized protein TNCV_113961 [Trichonephila clavipes]
MLAKSPFSIHKALIGIGGEPKSMKRFRSGDLFIETISALQTKCASVGHSSTNCSLEPKRINCSQVYRSDSKLCTKRKIERKIQEIKTNKNISYLEAQKLIVPQLAQTYAPAAISSNVSNFTETNENMKIVCPPLKLLQPASSPSRNKIYLHLFLQCSHIVFFHSSLPITFHFYNSTYKKLESQPPIPTFKNSRYPL